MLFAIGKYEDYGMYAIVEAAIPKMAFKKLADKIRKEYPREKEGLTEEEWNTDKKVIKKYFCMKTDDYLPIENLDDDVWIGENT